MSNYHVELIDKPAALTKEAIKSLRKQQVQGLSRRQLMRVALGTGDRAVAPRGHRRHARRSPGRTSPAASGRRSRSATSTRSSSRTRSLPIDEGFPAYYPEARAFVILIDPGQQRFLAGEDDDRRRHGAQRPGALPALSAPRLQAEPVPQELLARVPVPRLALRPARDQGGRRRSTARRRAAWTASRSPSMATGVLTINTGKITLGPLPVALGQPGIIPPRTPTGCI